MQVGIDGIVIRNTHSTLAIEDELSNNSHSNNITNVISNIYQQTQGKVCNTNL
jgi:RNase P/RNase MRP subunit p29